MRSLISPGWRVLQWAFALVLLCSLLLASGHPKGNIGDYVFSPGSARDLVKDGAWLRDSQGRYVLLRGVNFGSRTKLLPYIPVMPLKIKTLDHNQFMCELQTVRPHLARLHSLGMNVVRLPIMWKALEPRPNPDLDLLMPEGIQYLNYVKQIIDELYSDQLFVIVDFHQDIAHEVYGGNGFPDWALGIDHKHRRPSRPSHLKDKSWGLNYYDVPWLERALCHWLGYGSCGGNGPLVRNTLQSFWFNQLFNQEQTETERVTYMAQNPQTHFVKTIGQVAKFFAALNLGRGHPAIIGYEPFNEPHPVGLCKQNFEQNVLPKFYGQVETEINKYDAKALVFIEPRLDWTTYSATGPEFQGHTFTREPRSFLPTPYVSSTANGDVFSFHYYDPWMFPPFPRRNMHEKVNEWPRVFQQLQVAAVSRGLVPFLTEFGCDHNWEGHTDLRPDIYQHSVIRACMDLQFQQVEAQLLNETYWNYDLYNTREGHDNWNQEDFSLLGPDRSPRDLDIVVRPYPMRSSAMPQRVFFDLRSKNAAFILEGAVVDAPTVIFVPRCMHYPGHDFEVRATTPTSSVIWDEANQLLYWLPDKTLPKNQLIISPLGGFDSPVLPPDSQALLSQTAFAMVVGKNKKVPVPLAAKMGTRCALLPEPVLATPMSAARASRRACSRVMKALFGLIPSQTYGCVPKSVEK